MDGPNECFYSKQELRQLLLSRRKTLTDKPLRSRSACDKVSALLSGNVMVYISIGTELDTSYLIRELLLRSDISVFAPYTVDGTISARRIVSVDTPNKTGNMPENCYIDCDGRGKSQVMLDYCVTPLLGFNERGFRIGYGKGCYDKFFRDNDCKKIGLAFECQRQQFLPEFFDVPLDCCVTEEKVIYF